MAESEAGGAAAAGGGDAPTLVVNVQYLKDLSFESPSSPASLVDAGDRTPAVAVNVDVQAVRLKDRHYEVVLSIRAEARREDRVVFIAELHYGGLFTIDGAAGDRLQALLVVEAPRLLFPFARAILSESVRDGGFPPLLIHPIDFAGLLRQRMAEAAKEGARQGAAPDGASAADAEPAPETA